MLSHSARDASFYIYREKEADTDTDTEIERKRKRGIDVDRERVSEGGHEGRRKELHNMIMVVVGGGAIVPWLLGTGTGTGTGRAIIVAFSYPPMARGVLVSLLRVVGVVHGNLINERPRCRPRLHPRGWPWPWPSLPCMRCTRMDCTYLYQMTIHLVSVEVGVVAVAVSVVQANRLLRYVREDSRLVGHNRRLVQ